MDDLVTAVLERLDTTVADAVGLPVSVPGDGVLAGAVIRLGSLASRLVTAQAVLLRELDVRGVVKSSGAANATAWLRDHTRVPSHEAHKVAALGRLLDARPALAAACADGAVNTEQALAIGRAVGDIPASAGVEVIGEVETALIGHAAHLEPGLLRRLGDRTLAHVAPDVAEDLERRRLEREERQAARDRVLTLTGDGTGRTRVRGILDAESAEIVGAALAPLMKPVPASADGPDRRTAAARRADALVEVCRLALRTGDLPADGGQPPQLAITIDFDILAGKLGTATTDTGITFSAATARRLACDAAVLPIVLNSAGVVLDAGRNRRLYTGTARTAILIRDRGCAFPSCDRPPRWTDIHHIIAWHDGGPTDLDNGVALCGYHHRLIHHTGWEIRLGPDRRPQFIPPPDIDPGRTPRTNPYHQRT